MPVITINTDSKISNYDALEASAKWMLENYQYRDYKAVREVVLKSGRIASVREMESRDQLTTCNLRLEIKSIERGSIPSTKGDNKQ